ncbi:MAG: hypothetical protein SFX72_05650 [Isosphaeraceae bacterium]|nr:hypothetical protein [Isosphaeraceae bacterium]
MKSLPPDWSEPIVEKPTPSKAGGGRRLLIAVAVACLIALPAIGVWAALPGESRNGILNPLIWIVLLTAITAGAFTTVRVARRPRREAVAVEPGEDPPIIAKSQPLLGTPQSLEYHPSTGRVVCRGCRRARGFTKSVDPVWECSVDDIIAARISQTRGGPYLMLHTAESKITLFFQSGGKELLEAFRRRGIPMIGGPETDEPSMIVILNLWPYFGLLAMSFLSPLQMSDFRFYTGVVGAAILGAVVPYLIVWGAQRWFGIRLVLVLTGVTIGAVAGIGLGSVLALAARSEFVVMLLGDRSRAAWVLGIALGAWVGGAIGGWIQGKREAESALIRARGKKAPVPEV